MLVSSKNINFSYMTVGLLQMGVKADWLQPVVSWGLPVIDLEHIAIWEEEKSWVFNLLQ